MDWKFLYFTPTTNLFKILFVEHGVIKLASLSNPTHRERDIIFSLGLRNMNDDGDIYISRDPIKPPFKREDFGFFDVPYVHRSNNPRVSLVIYTPIPPKMIIEATGEEKEKLKKSFLVLPFISSMYTKEIVDSREFMFYLNNLTQRLNRVLEEEGISAKVEYEIKFFD